ncbi:MAG: TetR/AcrR family transcriptional regulator [Myxococcales bacterium]|jgi:AcrR family transcriptional regulator
MSRRARRKEQTLRRIEEAGWSLFTSGGYEATSTRQIAEAADIAAGTLFNYFPEKRALLIHLMQRRIDAAVGRALETMEKNSRIDAQLTHLFGALTECYAWDHGLSRVFVKELLFIDGTRRTESAAWTFGIVKRIAGLLSSAQNRGEIDPTVDPLDVAQQIFSLHYFGLVTWLGGMIPSRSAHESRFESSLRLLLRGLRRRAA